MATIVPTWVNEDIYVKNVLVFHYINSNNVDVVGDDEVADCAEEIKRSSS